MHPNDLNKIWLCNECGSVFIFHSDVENHMQIRNHSAISMRELESGELLSKQEI